MARFSLRSHPEVLFAFSANHVELIARVENLGERVLWAEADVTVPERLSLAPDHHLGKGRLRIGIIGKNEFLEKSVRVYANGYTNPQMYPCQMTLFTFNRDGVIEKRMEKSIDIRCEAKKEPSL